MFYFCQVLLYSPFPDIAMTYIIVNEVGADGKCLLKKFEHSGYGVVCTSPLRVTSSCVSMTEAAVSFEVVNILFKGLKISEEKCKSYVLSDFVTMKAPLWKHPMPLGLGRKKLSPVLNWFKDQLNYKITSKPKKVASFTGNLSAWTVGLGLKFHHCLSQADSSVPNREA